MEVKNSLSAYLNVTKALLTDISSASEIHWFPLSAANLTFKKWEKRVDKEGLSFLTKTLPRFGKALDRALSGSCNLSVPGFKTLPGSNLPIMLGEFTSRIFNNDGWIKPDPCIESVKVCRLLTSLYYKLEQTYEKQQEAECATAFKAVDASLPEPHHEYAHCADCSTEEGPLRGLPSDCSARTTYSCFPKERVGACKCTYCSIKQHATCTSQYGCVCVRASGLPWPKPEHLVSGCYYYYNVRGLLRGGEYYGRDKRCTCGVPRIIHGTSRDSVVRPGGDTTGTVVVNLKGHSHDGDGDQAPCTGNQTSGARQTGSSQSGGVTKFAKRSNCEGWKRLRSCEGLTGTREVVGATFGLLHSTLLETTRALLERLLCNYDARHIIPQHGPGAVSDGRDRSEKRFLRHYIPQLDRVYPYDQYMYWSPSHYVDELRAFHDLKIVEEPWSRFLCVPKDSRGPRSICAEMCELMFIQQGIRLGLTRHIHDNPLTKGCVSFVDQNINGSLAKEGSNPNGVATLDLKEASDRVSLRLIELVWPCNLQRVLKAVRSTHVVFPDGESIRLKKFAPMGSSLCFPVMAITIWAVATACLMVKYSLRDPSKVTGRIFVYGDDVVTPEMDAIDVMAALEAVGLKVNVDKSYTSGLFKESCGEDWFANTRVNGIKIRKQWSSRRSASHLTSWIDYSNQFHMRGCFRASGVIAEMLESMYGSLPRYPGRDPKDLSFPGFVHDNAQALDWKQPKRRWDKHLQRWTYHVLVSNPITYERPKVGWRDMLDTAIQGSKALWWQAERLQTVHSMHLSVVARGSFQAASDGAGHHDMGPSNKHTWNPWREFAVHKASKLAKEWRSDVHGG